MNIYEVKHQGDVRLVQAASAEEAIGLWVETLTAERQQRAGDDGGGQDRRPGGPELIRLVTTADRVLLADDAAEPG